MSKEDYREVLGARLKEFREKRGLTLYRVSKNSGLQIKQINDIESGSINYTIDSFLAYIASCELYMYFAEKENTKATTDFEEMIQKGLKERPE